MHRPHILHQSRVSVLTIFLLLVMAAFSDLTVMGAAPINNQVQSTATPDLAATATVSALLQLQLQIDATRTAVAQLSATPTQTPTTLPTATNTSTSIPATPTPRILATPTPRRVTPIAEVLVGGLNIRSGPGISYPVVTSGAIGQRFAVIGQSGNCTWLQVVLEDGSEGWMSGAAVYSRLNEPCSALPGGSVVVAPTPTVPQQMPTAFPRQQPTPARSTASGPQNAEISYPGNNHSSDTPTAFKWVADAPLAPGQEFEVIFWRAIGGTEAQGKGILRSSTATEVTQPVDKLVPDTYKWALILVQTEPGYQRIRRLAGPFNFTVPGEWNPYREPD